MTGQSPFAPPARPVPPSGSGRSWVCPRCQVRQADEGGSRCSRCGLPRHRWIAHPPPGGPPAAPVPVPARPYTGPPSYGPRPPRWSFPPVVWREAEPDGAGRRAPADPSGLLRTAAGLAAVTAGLALLAAVAESWRFVLLLDGRTKVLSATTVWSSDVLVAAAGAGSVAAAAVTLLVAVLALVRTYPLAAARLLRAPARSTGAVLARLLVPGWNLYGAGQVVTEIDRMLDAGRPGADPDAPGRAARLTAGWWVSWILSAALMAIALLRGLGGSLQAIADTVELHIAVDLAAALCAGVGAAMLLRFARLLRRRPAIPTGWVVREPEPTRDRPAP